MNYFTAGKQKQKNLFSQLPIMCNWKHTVGYPHPPTLFIQSTSFFRYKRKNSVFEEFPKCSETEDMSKVQEIFNSFK